MNTHLQRPFRLINRIQHYDWGTKNGDAFIPQLIGMSVEPGRPYAELWIGAHPSAPSSIQVDGRQIPLNEVISSSPIDILGEDVARRFDNTLPFLLKVLSAATALSIQTHPNKQQARRLHAIDPAHYPDDNHKPEIAIALDSLTALAGFRPAGEIVERLIRFPEIHELVGADLLDPFVSGREASEWESSPSKVYAAIMRRANDAHALRPVVDRIAKRLAAKGKLEAEELLFVEQFNIHGADVGLFSFLFLNLIHLNPGQGIFTDAGVPHAYIKGNIVECMANSDNVVRAGLTGKFKDVDTLLDILTCRFGKYEILNEKQQTDGVVYRSGASEFEVTGWLKGQGYSEERTVSGGPVVILVTEGSLVVEWHEGPAMKAESFSKGSSLLLPAALQWRRFCCAEQTRFFSVSIP